MEIPRPRIYSFGLTLLVLVVSVYLGVFAFFALGLKLTVYSWVITSALYSLGVWWIGKTFRQSPFLHFALGGIVFALSALLSLTHYETTWDGQWYHYSAIHQLMNGWNPFTLIPEDEGRVVLGHSVRALLYYAKLPWFFAASTAQLFGNQIEAGKNLNLILTLAAFLVIAGRFFTKPFHLLTVALWTLAVAVPVTITQSFSFYCDAAMALTLLLTFVFGYDLLRYGVTLSRTAPALLSILITVNTKNFSVVYLLIGFAVLVTYFYREKKEHLVRFIKFAVVAIPVSVFIFGYQPYSTNLRRGLFFLYPIEPSWVGQHIPQIGRQLSPTLETSNRYEKLAASIFGKSSASFPQDETLRLKFPFTFSRGEANGAGYYDARSGGFGPFYSGILLVVLLLTAWRCIRSPKIRLPALLAICGLFMMVSVNPESWWARWSPGLWWFPWFLLILFLPESTKLERKAITALVVIGFLNLGIAGFGWAKRIRLEQRELNSRFEELEENTGQFSIIYGDHDSLKTRIVEKNIIAREVSPPIRCGSEKRFFPNSTARYCLDRHMLQ